VGSVVLYQAASVNAVVGICTHAHLAQQKPLGRVNVTCWKLWSDSVPVLATDWLAITRSPRARPGTTAH